MARRRAVEIVIAEGTCGCGCGEAVVRSFKQGHDQRLKGVLGRAHRAGDPVRLVSDGKRTTSSAQELLEARGWRVPAAWRDPRSSSEPSASAGSSFMPPGRPIPPERPPVRRLGSGIMSGPSTTGGIKDDE